MVRRTVAVALLCLTLLFCGLDTSAVGHPAEAETALHAMVHGPTGGARDVSGLVLAAAFVALAALAALAGRVALAVRCAEPRSARRVVVRAERQPSVGWHTAHATRGPPALV